MGYEVTVLAGQTLSPVTDSLLARDLAEMTDVHCIREKSLLRRLKERKREDSAPGPAYRIQSRRTRPKKGRC